ncbi:MAG: glycoside hydrolase family 31 protein, partial [Anaerolineae bacterium]|nr:glycoside hydrolase family 31 protein [Anaerolineae bacterium]
IAETEDASYLDFTNPAGYGWWQDRLTATLLDYGIDVPWNDNNEFEIRDGAARCAGYGEPLPVVLARPTQTVLMGQASFEAVKAARPGQRPYVLTRSGAPGVQRYAQTWSGDNASTWHALRYNTPMGLGLSLSGLPNCGHDVGGFMGDAPSPELLLRWVQKAIFEPRFTIHSVGLAGLATEPWMYPDILPLVRDAIRFRYRLIPYLYTLLAESARAGAPIIRPLVYHFPQDARCRTESFDFMLGPNLLVAPVLEPGMTQRDIYLPGGLTWLDFHSGAAYAGGQVVTLDAPLDGPDSRIPLLVPARGLLPLAPPTDTPVVNAGAREVCAFPDPAGGEGAFTLVEDDGESLDYRAGAQTRLTLRLRASAEAIHLSAGAPQGGYPLPYDAVTFVLPPGEARPITGGDELPEEDGRRRVVVRVKP